MSNIAIWLLVTATMAMAGLPGERHADAELVWETRGAVMDMLGRVVLVMEYFSAHNMEGQRRALLLNLLNPIIGEVHIYANKSDASDPFLQMIVDQSHRTHTAAVVHQTNIRLNVGEFIHVANATAARDAGRLVALANSDISFDLSLANLRFMLTTSKQRRYFSLISRLQTVVTQSSGKDKFQRDMCLTNKNSADVFVLAPPTVDPAPFRSRHITLGNGKVENVIARHFTDAGFDIVNPCRFVNVFHHHDEDTVGRVRRKAEANFTRPAFFRLLASGYTAPTPNPFRESLDKDPASILMNAPGQPL